MKRVVVTVLLVLLASCSMPETKIYSLVVPAEKATPVISSGAPLNITVSSPRYLTQSYIAYRVSPYQIEIAKYSRWDMPPADLVRDSFRDAISSSGLFSDVQTFLNTPPGYSVLEINLKRFEREDEGGTSFARLQFDVRLRSPEGREIYFDTISKKVRLEDRTFLGLAKTISESLSEDLEQVETGLLKALTGPKQ
jgi:uncharacterized lipoprotein YmbA